MTGWLRRQTSCCRRDEGLVGISFTTGPDGKIWQLPDQQFANLYWFRHDWFKRPEIKKAFKDKYVRARVPVNWSAAKTSPSFQHAGRRSMASASTAIWTTASVRLIWAGA
jgi:ABC-type glycerol-3-phosphate transport system substrate-binding protein